MMMAAGRPLERGAGPGRAGRSGAARLLAARLPQTMGRILTQLSAKWRQKAPLRRALIDSPPSRWRLIRLANQPQSIWRARIEPAPAGCL